MLEKIKKLSAQVGSLLLLIFAEALFESDVTGPFICLFLILLFSILVIRDLTLKIMDRMKA